MRFPNANNYADQQLGYGAALPAGMQVMAISPEMIAQQVQEFKSRSGNLPATPQDEAPVSDESGFQKWLVRMGIPATAFSDPLAKENLPLTLTGAALLGVIGFGVFRFVRR